MKKYQHSVFIGRFQPFHNAHKLICKEALKISDELIIVIGSYRSPISIKNPFTYEDRRKMVYESFSQKDQERIQIIEIRDFMYSEKIWLTSLQNKISKLTTNPNSNQSSKVVLVGCKKDESSYYLDMFPQWDFEQQPTQNLSKFTEDFHAPDSLNASDIRKSIFEEKYNIFDGNWNLILPSKRIKNQSFEVTGIKISELVSKNVYKFLQDWVEKSEVERIFKGTPSFRDLQEEYEFTKNYHKKWENSPYPPAFITADSLIIKSGHVLLIKRKINPGKGKYALPGGFVNADETIFQGAMRELREETKIRVPEDELLNAYKKVEVFDHPHRDLRGRFVTHCHLFELDSRGALPKVEAGDDAGEAVWMAFNDLVVNEENFFADHLHIIQKMI